ncbi:hypothetical protein ACVIWV_003601 [Bradyrhizobium diazoefficiens]|jgi:hypothetical protein|uniref:Bsl4153 protein n=3 Tax=Bradyrhizobium diazoefficiens TaxID=1355477 RepID=Q89MN9_BRADU|nr:DUF6719 family protein [Bradyrhizobium diazoefficiens]MBP1065855.1 hypothetical protein [Bradyrhizobium japonicum]AND89448.1 hypothetical protein AAV28_17805 [Bradyrhizobium diazoefficiens USDA 110]AWO91088.1 hypothetical protein DI395_23020 [Bradyrhizobium diazoefficiens]MBP1093240.1 hypothetical protein [Bradyrhizobium japonicum]MBR0862657.1 hypothetical protein [Bradyrhizobium diazoefficiens]
MSLRRAACLSLLIAIALASTARAGTVGREQDIVDLKLGQRVLVDDGTCPAGQVKEVRGAKMTDKGIAQTSSCVPRHGPKSK